MIEVENMLLETTVGRVLFNMELPGECVHQRAAQEKGLSEPGRLAS